MKVLFFIPIAVILVSCGTTQFLTRTDRAQYPISVYPQHTISHSKELFAGDQYLHAIPDSSASAELTNAIGFYLQELGYSVYTISNDSSNKKNSFAIKSNKVEFREVIEKEYIEQISCHDTLSKAIRLEGLRFRYEGMLIPQDSVNEAQEVSASSKELEGYSEGTLSKETSLLGMLAGKENDKTAFNGEIYSLYAKDISYQLIYRSAKDLALQIDNKINYYHFHNKTFKRKRVHATKKTGIIENPKQNFGLKK